MSVKLSKMLSLQRQTEVEFQSSLKKVFVLQGKQIVGITISNYIYQNS